MSAGWGPRVFLLVCAPVVVDLLFGATQLSSIVALVPETVTYGCAALLIRGFARQRGAGLATVIVWGFAFAVLAECVIVQTSLAPLTGVRWGRALGVNWPYLVWAVGYESCWGIALSIGLTELVFPASRDAVWPGRRGRWGLAVVFVLGAVPTWYNWTQVVAPALSHLPPYQPPLSTLAVALVVVAGLVVLGARLPRAVARTTAPRPVLAGGVAFVAGALWFGLLVGGAVVDGLVVLVVGGLGVVLARWVRVSDRHRIAVVTGALVASMGAGFLVNQFTVMDLVVKVALDVGALAGLVVLYRRRSWDARRVPTWHQGGC